jgi:SNF2 family DNA or RNA helicase
MLKITEETIIDRVEYYDTYIKGKQYFNTGRVREVRTNTNYDYFIGSVLGSSVYSSTAEFNAYGNITATSCSCPAFRKLSGDCKHIVALLMKIREYDRDGRLNRKKSEGNIENIIQQYRDVSVERLIPVNLEINYEASNEGNSISFRIGEDKLYVIKSLSKFLSNLIDNKETVFGKGFTFLPSVHCFSDKDKELIEFLKLIYENYDSVYSHGYSTNFSGKRLNLTPITEEKFFDLMTDRNFNMEIGGTAYRDIAITDDKLELNFKLVENDRDLVLGIDNNEVLSLLTTNGKYFLYNGKVYKLPPEQRKVIMPIYNEITNKDIKQLRIKDEMKEVFVSEMLPIIKRHSNLKIDEEINNTIYNPPINPTIYFDRIEEIIFGRLLFNYGDIEINPFSSENYKKDPKKILVRDIETENEILTLLEHSEFKVEDGRFFLEEEELIFDFINDIVPQLQSYCDIFYSDSFRNIGLIGSDNFAGGLKLDTSLDMLEFSFDIEGIDFSELGSIFRALKEKKRYYKLKNGSFLSLESRELHDIVDIFDRLELNLSKLEDGKIKIPKYRTLYLDKLLKDRGIDYIKRNIDFKRLVRDINEPEDSEVQVPQQLNAQLRDYQVFGFKWLKTLSRYGFGGILADEMGLGKTIQVLTFLLSEKQENNHGTSIIVVPTSLVYNWEEEVKKFTPTLRTLIISGTKEERSELIKTVADYDIVITSYPLMRRDIEEYQQFIFEHCILDEAQHIKNHSSLNAKSVKNINAKQYFALTGTPMENSLSELWSIFDYLMPGYLHSYGKFSIKYERPISKENDNIILKDLYAHIRPFILRRLKKDVLKELPDKIEQKFIVDMTNEQKKLYLAYLQAIKGEISEEISARGYNRSHIKILAGLTRLRQICCHPGIFIDDYEGDSGKLDSLVEIVEEAINGGHRILIFSQFTTMLQKIRDTFDSKGIKCQYLDGSTPMAERGESVRTFNKGRGDVFLISLKAGGTGLNLTSADMVIHYDPWWNPAVEDQATDRAHRIGQENSVQVIKLITKGTIEEKIFLLQEHKKELIDKVIQEGQTLISKLTETEIMSLFE